MIPALDFVIGLLGGVRSTFFALLASVLLVTSLIGCERLALEKANHRADNESHAAQMQLQVTQNTVARAQAAEEALQMAAHYNQIAAETQRNNDEARKQTDRLVADLRGGNLRLRKSLDSALAATEGQGDGTSPGVSDGSEATDLSVPNAAFLLRVGAEADGRTSPRESTFAGSDPLERRGEGDCPETSGDGRVRTSLV